MKYNIEPASTSTCVNNRENSVAKHGDNDKCCEEW